MTTLEIAIPSDTDELFVMTILNALADKKLIQLNPLASIVRPGSPLSVARLNEYIDQLEESGRVSIDEAKMRLGL